MNARLYPGMWLRATEDNWAVDNDRCICKGDEVQLLSYGQGLNPKYFTFVGIKGRFEHTGKGWEVVRD